MTEEYKPKRVISHLLTAYAVQRSVQFICDEFAKRFHQLSGVPIMFYDWQQGFSQQLQQELAKVPQKERNEPWYCILYSYGASKPNPHQPRPLPDSFRQLGELENGDPVATELACRLAQVNVVCDVVTNDSNYADAIAAHRMLRQSYWESFEYQDVMYPAWKPEMQVYAGQYMLSALPNGHMYRCRLNGITAVSEPNWPTQVGYGIQDGTTVWECIEPRMAKASVGDHTLPEISQSTVYDEGIRYIVRFGYGLNYVLFEDIGNHVTGLLQVYDTIWKLISSSYPEIEDIEVEVSPDAPEPPDSTAQDP